MSFQNIHTKSQELKQIFEYELRRKLSEKTKNPINSLLTSFHYFDTDNSGAATLSMWLKTFTKIGLSGFSQTDMQIIFDCYDLNHSGLIDYKNFSYYLYDQCQLQPIPKEVANEINSIILNQEQEHLKKLKQFHSELPQMIGSDVYKQNLNERLKFKIKGFNQKNSSNIANILNPKLNEINKNIYKKNQQYDNNFNINNNNFNNNNNINYNNSNINNNNNVLNRYFQNNNNNNINNINNENNNNNNININNNQTKYIQTLIELFRNKININSGITFYKFANNLLENTFNNNYYSNDINNKFVNFETFCKSLNDSNIHIENFYCQDFFNFLLNNNNFNNNNSIFIDDILNVLKGDINTFRKNIIINKFYEMDNNKRGIIETGVLLKIFNAKNHPEVLLGRKTENEIFNDFIYTFDIFKKLYNLSSVITVNDFVEYYKAISASIDSDEYFTEMINAVWNNNINNNVLSKSFNFKNSSKINQVLNEDNNQNENNFISTYNSNYNNNNLLNNKNNNNYYYKRNFSHSAKRRYNSQPKFQYNPITNEYSIPDINNVFNGDINEREYSKTPFHSNNYFYNKNIQNSTSNFNNALNTLRNILISRGPKSIFILERLFVLTHSNQIDFQTFNNLTQTYKLNISNNEKKTIFDYFDTNSNGFIFYDNLIKSLCGKINDFRLNIVINVFNSFNNKNNNNKISLNNILSFYNKNSHPDVLTGKKLAEEVFGDFIDMVNIFKEYKEFINNNAKYDFWSVQDFVDFYSQISLGITDDAYFECLMKNVWNFDNNYYYNFNNNINNQRIKTGTAIMNGGY